MPSDIDFYRSDRQTFHLHALPSLRCYRMCRHHSRFRQAATGLARSRPTEMPRSQARSDAGRRMTPVSITVSSSSTPVRYNMEMAQDRLLSPMLLQMMIYSALDATERTLGSGAVRIHGQIEFDGRSRATAIRQSCTPAM